MQKHSAKQYFAECSENFCPMIQQIWKEEKSEINTLVYMMKWQTLVETWSKILPVADEHI